MNRLHANALLLLAGAIWGMGFVAQATAMDSVGPFLFIALRFLVACVVVFPFVLMESSNHRQQHRAAESGVPSRPEAATEGASYHLLTLGDIAKFGLIGVSLFVGMACQQVGLLSTSVTNSGFLTGLYVVFTPLIVIALFKERPHPIVWPAASLALLGIFLLSGGDPGALVVGDVLTIFSAVFWALQVVMIARFVGQSGRPLALSFVQFLVTAVLGLLAAMVLEPIVWASIVDAAPEILYTGVFASGIAFTLQVIGQRHTTAPQAAIFLSSEAPFAALFAFLWLGERIGIIGVGGCVMIFAAMLLVELVPEWQSRRVEVKPS
ncbi:MAG: DMT family transporter [Granulosicoccus sp.]